VPHGDLKQLGANVRNLQVFKNDDAHGSPRHAVESQLWTASCILGMRGTRSLQRAAFDSLLRVSQARRRLVRAAA
jgi:hypothetical protein